MPRVSTVKTDEEVTVPKKRAPRKRVVATDEEGVTPRPRARRAPVKRTAETVVSESETTEREPVRRAPTPLRAERQAAKHSSKILVIATVILVIFSGVGIAIGMSDQGEIDVVAVVNERNEKIGRGEVRDGNNEAVTQTVPVQNTDTRPNGGLVPMDPSEVPPPAVTETPVEVASTTATTTEETVADTEVDPTPADASTEPAPTPVE